MRKQLVAVTLTALLAALSLTGCSNADSSETSTKASVSTNQNDPVHAALDAMGNLNIQHTKPERTSVDASGAKEVYSITINGHDAGINVYPDTSTRDAWLKTSDSMGGVSVAYGNSAISFNSSDGIQDSIQIAPKLAEKLGGEAHGVGHTTNQ